MKNDKNNTILDPKKVHNDSLDALRSSINLMSELISDAVSVPHATSKNILLKSCLEQFKYMRSCMLNLSQAVELMRSNPETANAHMKSILKQCGLQDMDDPSYAEGKYFVEGERACDKLREMFTPDYDKPPAGKEEFPKFSIATKEDVDSTGMRANLDDKQYVKLPIDKELGRADSANDDEENDKQAVAEEQTKKTKRRTKKTK